ncbi:MAG: DUF1460 domain-containing protein [Acidobacteria bacterium]|nr:DUF1460 domain-containing protein [Acidobacteriota bacterium]
MSQKKETTTTVSPINRLLKAVAAERDLAKRIAAISEHFIGCPYAVNPLGGGMNVAESLVINLAAFDCVTFNETVLALALAKTAQQFKENLVRLRYRNGEVTWQKRHHYMVDWWRNNERLGVIANLTQGEGAVEKLRELNVVAGLPTRRVQFRVFPKKIFKRVEKAIKTGDFVCFGTTKKNLDVFHTGILLRRDDTIVLRHASRTAGQVVEQGLPDFLQRNRMSGMVLLRPRQK